MAFSSTSSASSETEDRERQELRGPALLPLSGALDGADRSDISPQAPAVPVNLTSILKVQIDRADNLSVSE